MSTFKCKYFCLHVNQHILRNISKHVQARCVHHQWENYHDVGGQARCLVLFRQKLSSNPRKLENLQVPGCIVVVPAGKQQVWLERQQVLIITCIHVIIAGDTIPKSAKSPEEMLVI